jgi:RHS repeat-associated protein
MLIGIRLTSRADTAATVTQLYKPLRQAQDDAWGETRYSSGTLPTDYTYTGQYSHTDDPSMNSGQAFGLMYYNARWYDPVLGRFAQADTLVPGAGIPLAWDRYAYAMNSPISNVDPSGHRSCTAEQAATGDETCDQNSTNDKPRKPGPCPPPDSGDGCEWVLITPNGEGQSVGMNIRVSTTIR